MPRSLSFDPQEVLATVAELFRQHGFADTSMRDVQKATGLAPTSLYAAFGNKEQLFEQALAHYRQQIQGQMAAMLGDPQDGLACIERYLNAVVEHACAKFGCLLGRTWSMAVATAPQQSCSRPLMPLNQP